VQILEHLLQHLFIVVQTAKLLQRDLLRTQQWFFALGAPRVTIQWLLTQSLQLEATVLEVLLEVVFVMLYMGPPGIRLPAANCPKNLLWDAVIWHSNDMTNPAKLCLQQECLNVLDATYS